MTAEITVEEIDGWLLNTPDAPLSQGEGIEGYLRERDERELETGKDDPQGAINYWQLAANHANEEVTKLIAERDKLKEEVERLTNLRHYNAEALWKQNDELAANNSLLKAERDKLKEEVERHKEEKRQAHLARL